MPNRLSQEASPYLLQHAGNPVDWYPWGEAAFERARQEDKPIFLSIGYSTCHWCHVMERESFENDAVADVLNGHFVAVKVDREERPDVDRVYMAFVQATTGSGGWPMSVWLTPALEPFFGGTYFPPTSRWGRPGFVEVLEEIARLWRDDRDRILQNASALTERLRAAHGAGRAEAAPALAVAGADAIETGADAFAQTFDRRRGGFGGAPKFPRPSELFFLLRAHACGRSPAAREMVAVTLRSMAEGGMYDQLGGGFHRYSVDAEWRVPHFEKMLYDQAQLVLALLEAAQATGDPFFADIVEETLAYLSRDLTDASGGFYSAEDADSVPPEEAADPRAHKSEGAFYLWRWAEVESLLGADADVVRYRYGLEPSGNALEDPQGELRGRNLLYVARPVADVARLTGRSPEEVQAALGRARIAMSNVRARRPRPHLDDKILAGWNGLMIAAFARAVRTLEAFDTPSGARPTARWLESAERAARFLRTTMWDEPREVLRRRYRAGEASIDGYSEDYAFVVWGLLELFQTTGAAEWLTWAARLEARQDELFWDEAGAGWFSTDGRDPSVLFRMKDDYDGAEPSAGSVSVLNLLAMAHLTGDAGAFGRAERTLQRYGPRLGQMARVLPMMMAALTTYHAGPGQVAIVGPRDREDTRALRAALASRYAPFTVVVPIEPGADQTALAACLPWTSAMAMRSGRATAYVCENFACREPITTPEDLKRALAGAQQ